MGWTYSQHRPRSIFDFMKAHFDFENERTKREIIDVAASLTVAYAAYRVTNKADNKSYVVALVVLLHHAPNAKDGYVFGTKEMEEMMGPCESECPERILRQLSPLEEFCPPGTSGFEWASNWRRRCEANIERKKKAAKVKLDTKIRFASEIAFTDGHKASEFTIERAFPRKRRIFRSTANGRIYWIRNWRKLDFSVEAP
jgi:hypothetical protein